MKALEDALAVIDSIAFPIDTNDRAHPSAHAHTCACDALALTRCACVALGGAGEAMLKIVNSCIGTKYTSRFGPLMAELALDAVRFLNLTLIHIESTP